MSDDEIKDLMKEITGKIRIGKVTATRSLRGNNGNTFAGFTALHDSIVDESGMVIEAEDNAGGGLGLRDARLAYYILQMQADLAAINAAWACGDLSDMIRDEMLRSTKRNFALLIRQAARGPEGVNHE